LLEKWNISRKGEALSQRVMDKVKPDFSLKNKIDVAQKKLEFQITKLDSIHEKLQKKHNYVFDKIVNAQRVSNHTYAKAYAIELAEIRKMKNMIGGAKLAMEQINIRLNTVSELGDIVVTLSPCMSIIKGLGTSISGMMPEANSSLLDLSKTLGDVLSGSSVGSSSDFVDTTQQSAETIAILEEAHEIIEGQARNSIPEIPTDLSEKITERKEAFI
jgi:division protein CdvB (Snf7/Vps24/ESCRT-III family)